MKQKKNQQSHVILKPWQVHYHGFNAEEEGLREALCTLGNGYMGTRGAACECAASDVHYPGTYLAGVYNKTPTLMAGRKIYNEDLVNVTNWLPLKFRIEDRRWISPATSKILSYEQELDIRRGILKRSMRFEDGAGHRTRVETRRIVSMADPHSVAIEYTIYPENYSGDITIRSELDGTVENTGVARYRKLNTKHLYPVAQGTAGREIVFLTVKTRPSNITIATAARLRVYVNKRKKDLRIQVGSDRKNRIIQECTLTVKKGHSYTIEKVVAVYTSRDNGIPAPEKTALRQIKAMKTFRQLYAAHAKAWQTLWRRCDVVVDGDPFAQFVLRLHTFHLLQSYSSHNKNADVSIGARGLHGEAYRGHIFWDTLFLMPFYDLHLPAVSQALLKYRYCRLPLARKYARTDGGYQGAMFPWQSGSAGVEETQVVHLNPVSGKWGPDYSRIQRHVSFAIAYNVWHYYVRTHDRAFLRDYGAELLLSIAQFAASLAQAGGRDKKFHTEGIMGPDEFHEKFPGSKKHGLRNNAYTNFLIVWVLMRARETLNMLSRPERNRLMKKIKLTERALAQWDMIIRHMAVIINEQDIISQFDGYFSLKELNWKQYRKKYGDIHRMDRLLKAEGKSPDAYKVAKQADVLMIFYLLPLEEVRAVFQRMGYRLTAQALKRNYEYYVQRTSHGSTLSRVVHCYIALLLGRMKESWKWYTEVLRSDLYDIQGGTTAEGIHTGVMGGSLAIALQGYAGVYCGGNGISIMPRLPGHWKQIAFRLLYRGYWISVSITHTKVLLTVESRGKRKLFPYAVKVYGIERKITAGKRYTFKK